MKRVVSVLAATTLIFAASTFYYARLLTRERARPALALVPTPLATSQPPRASHQPADTDPIKPDLAAAPRKDGAHAAGGNERDPGQIATARYQLDQLLNPAGRAERVRVFASLFREDWRSLGPHLGLTPAEVEQVVGKMAELTAQRAQRRFECTVDPACDLRANEAAPGMSQADMIAAALGPERYARYQAYQESSQENSVAFWLNSQLPAANAMSDMTSDKLVQALAEQRRQFVRDAEARGEKIEGEAGGVVRSAATTGAPDEYARRRESAAEYTRRAVELAAQVLNPEQLAVFREIAERDLYNYSDRMRDAEIASSAGKASGGQP